jgi:hypothetical protein
MQQGGVTVLDGPLCSVLLEGMNTVLDDNKKLVPSAYAPKIDLLQGKICFETNDLSAASPALVSRCSCVSHEPDELEPLLALADLRPLVNLAAPRRRSTWATTLEALARAEAPAELAAFVAKAVLPAEDLGPDDARLRALVSGLPADLGAQAWDGHRLVPARPVALAEALSEAWSSSACVAVSLCGSVPSVFVPTPEASVCYARLSVARWLGLHGLLIRPVG